MDKLPATSYVRLVDFWLIMGQLVPFIEVSIVVFVGPLILPYYLLLNLRLCFLLWWSILMILMLPIIMALKETFKMTSYFPRDQKMTIFQEIMEKLRNS